MTEQWRDIQGYEGLYQISDMGRIKGLEKIVKHRQGSLNIPERFVSIWKNNTGYPSVSLWKNGKQANHQIHRLIMIAFVPNPENKEYVNHINGIKSDYRIENLEWSTPSENNQHAYDYALRRTIPVVRGDGVEYESIKEASEAVGVSHSRITDACSGKQRTSAGYTWQYRARR